MGRCYLFLMRYRSIVIAALSTTMGIAVVHATSALSAFRITPQRACAKVPAHSVKADVTQVFATAAGPVVTLQPQGMQGHLPIWIGYTEAKAIHRALKGQETDRPRTHDLFSNVLNELDAKVAFVRVDRLHDGVYYGTVTLRTTDRVLSIDARPSDALALALRLKAPIYIDRSLQSEFITP